MSADIVRLKPETGFLSIEEMMARVRIAHPNAKHAIMIVFEADGMYPYFQCSSRDIAVAATRLVYLANQEE